MFYIQWAFLVTIDVVSVGRGGDDTSGGVLQSAGFFSSSWHSSDAPVDAPADALPAALALKRNVRFFYITRTVNLQSVTLQSIETHSD